VNAITRKTTGLAVLAAVGALVLAGCSGTPSAPVTPGGSAALTSSDTLTVVTHDSFSLTDAAKAQFANETGYKVTYIAPGDAGTVVNQLILTKDSPLGDVVYGIDNTFAGRAIDAGVLSPYASPALPAGASAYAVDGSAMLTPIDYGDVCVNADDGWFAAHGLALPVTLDDLAKPEYKGLLVVPNPATSSPGLAFLIATVGAKGDPGYLDYWKALKANGVEVVDGWTQAYDVEFSGSSGKGPKPLVVSYSSDPSSEIGADGKPTTSILPQTCFRQVEYAGVIQGASNAVGARKFIDFMLSNLVQSQIPAQMYMSPVDPNAAVPADWTKFTSAVTSPIQVPASEISAKRDTWIQDWTNTVVG